MINTRSKTWLDPKGLRLAIEKASVSRLLLCALAVRNEAVRSMQKGGRSKDGKRGVPAPPGEPPHRQTTNLANQIKAAETATFGAIVGPTRQAWYGKIHEFGGRHHPKRPFMLPALEKAKSRFPALFAGINLRIHQPEIKKP